MHGAIREVLGLLRSQADTGVKWRLAGALLLVTSGGLLAGLAPLALKAMVDTLAADQNADPATQSHSAVAYGAAYLAALCCGRLMTEIRPLVSGTAEQRLQSGLRQRFFDHVLDLRLAFHLERRSGVLLHTLHQSTAACQLILTHLVSSIVPVVVEVVTLTLVLVHLGQPALVATFGLTGLLYLATIACGIRPIHRRVRAVSDASMHTHATLADGLINFETVKCFNAEGTVRQRLAQASDALEVQWSQLHRQRARLGLALTATFTVSVATSLAFATEAVAQGKLTVGGFVLATVYMLQIVRPLEMLGAAARDVSQAAEFIRPLLEILKEPTEAPLLPQLGTHQPGHDKPSTSMARHGTVDPRPMAPTVRFQDVHFGYGAERVILDGFDLDIQAGRSVAIVGASGSGKSSLVRLLLRLYEVQAGRILLDGVPINLLPVGNLRAMIGVVPQDTVLFNDTIARNIGIGRPHANLQDIEHAAHLAQLDDFISTLPAGYETVVGERGLKLSGGERQRIAIARAVLKRPRLYIFDEATSMLDSQTEAIILRNLREVTAGCTTVTIAHRLSTIRSADEIVVLEHGRVVERGAHTQLLVKCGAYSRLWHTQTDGGP